MIATKTHVDPSRDFPAMTRDELASEWQVARAYFDEALANKTATDRIYMAAANHLNALERLIKKGEHQQGVADRRAAKSKMR